ncbi:MAG: transglycosylase SLT domain-containing protein [Cyanobium sp.]
MIRLPRLLAITCCGTGAAVLLGWRLQAQRPLLTPATPVATLERVRRWSPDPVRRREASLLLAARPAAADDPQRQRQVLRHQGWGADPLAAPVLRREARAAEALQRPLQAQALWRALWRRFPTDPAAADALYSLGRDRRADRLLLLQRFPAHPAALAAALEAGPEPALRRLGVLHLARWGPRWPGAEERLRRACGPGVEWTPSQRASLASALAELGDSEAALRCARGGAPLSAPAQLALARSLLQREAALHPQAVAMLLDLARRTPAVPQAEEAVRLLSVLEGEESEAALARLPDRHRNGAAVAARRALAAGQDGPVLHVLRRWPADPAIWDLQWERSRQQLLAGRWAAARTLLQAIDGRQLSPPLEARRRFWLGYALARLGERHRARDTWRQLQRQHPGGYYGWRAAVQLGGGALPLSREVAAAALSGRSAPGISPAAAWQPLDSGDPELDRLWRLAQRTEAWESWRHRRGGRPPQDSQALLVEGRLRQAVGDDWIGLGQLEQALMRLPADQCRMHRQLERDLHPIRFPQAFAQAARRHGLQEALLLGLAKQESRFTPAVHSAVGAVGLMQLMPETAAELAGRSLTAAELEEPQRNSELGASYLRRLLQQWQHNPWLTIASYNAGPGAVQSWIEPRLQQAPELWVEAIPYPETRLYVKKVLGNVWSYQQQRLPGCGAPRH